jgi:hypothetical protein
MHRNINSLRRPDDSHPVPPEPTRDEIAGEHLQLPVEMEREVRELVGQCLWDMFSDGHEVVGPAGRVLDLGSLRASGGFLADVVKPSGASRRPGWPLGGAAARPLRPRPEEES